MLRQLSAIWARAELLLAAVLAAAITGLILTNVVTRAFDASIYWIDEAAIYAMIWMSFLAASAAVANRSSVAVTLLPDTLPPRAEGLVVLAVDLVILAFAMLMIWFCWRWFDPPGLIGAGFDVETFQGDTFNFVYSEPTSTIGMPKGWIWAVMPLFSVGLTLHALSNLAETVSAALSGRSVHMERVDP